MRFPLCILTPFVLLALVGCGFYAELEANTISHSTSHQDFDLEQIQTIAIMPNVEIADAVDRSLGDVSLDEMRVALLDACALALAERGVSIVSHEAAHNAFFELEIDPGAVEDSPARDGLPSRAVTHALGEALGADAFVYLTVDDWGGGLDAGDRIDIRAELIDAQSGDLLWEARKKTQTQGRTPPQGLRDAILQEMFAPYSLR